MSEAGKCSCYFFLKVCLILFSAFCFSLSACWKRVGVDIEQAETRCILGGGEIRKALSEMSLWRHVGSEGCQEGSVSARWMREGGTRRKIKECTKKRVGST